MTQIVSQKTIKIRIWKRLGADKRLERTPAKTRFRILKSVMERWDNMMDGKETFSDVLEEEVRREIGSWTDGGRF